ncbi:hypothetical protein ACIBIZ_33175 [Nonomuraea spiralis]|uniref:hypothetical protein n=1 Tax=Nonomuraea spiralis TaxID=46182 RepID=UPI00378743F4
MDAHAVAPWGECAPAAVLPNYAEVMDLLGEAQRLIRLIRPEIYVKGGDYTAEMPAKAPLVRSLGGEVLVLGYLPDRSTTAIIGRIRSVPGDLDGIRPVPPARP